MFFKKVLFILTYCFYAVSQAKYINPDETVINDKLSAVNINRIPPQNSRLQEQFPCKECKNVLPGRKDSNLSRKKRDFPTIQTRNEQFSQRSYSQYGGQSTDYANHAQESHITGISNRNRQLRQTVPQQQVRDQEHFGEPGIQTNFPQSSSSDLFSSVHRRLLPDPQNANGNSFSRNAFGISSDGRFPMASTHNSDYDLKLPMGFEVRNDHLNIFHRRGQLPNEFQRRTFADFPQYSGVQHGLPSPIPESTYGTNRSQAISGKKKLESSSMFRSNHRIFGEQSAVHPQHLVPVQRQHNPISMTHITNGQGSAVPNYRNPDVTNGQGSSLSSYWSTQTSNGHASSSSSNRNPQASNGQATSSFNYGNSQTNNGQVSSSSSYWRSQPRNDPFLNQPHHSEGHQRYPHNYLMVTHRPIDSNTETKDQPSTHQTHSIILNRNTNIPPQKPGSISSSPIGSIATNYPPFGSIPTKDCNTTRQADSANEMSVSDDTSRLQLKLETHTAALGISQINLTSSGQNGFSVGYPLSRESDPSLLSESMLTPRVINQGTIHRISGSDSAVSQTKLQPRFENTTTTTSSTELHSRVKSQTQVQGGYSGNGTFSAQTQSGLSGNSTHSQVHEDKKEKLTSSNGTAEGIGLTQSQIQLNPVGGSVPSSVQGRFSGGTQVRVQIRNTEDQSQFRDSNNIQVNLNIAGHEKDQHDAFHGTASASVHGSRVYGQSETQHEDNNTSGRTYMANAQGGYDTTSQNNNYFPKSGYSLSLNVSHNNGTGHFRLTGTDTAVPMLVQREPSHVPTISIGSRDAPITFKGLSYSSTINFNPGASNQANFPEHTVETHSFASSGVAYPQAFTNAAYPQRFSGAEYPQGSSNTTYARGSSRSGYPQGFSGAAYPQGSSGDAYPQSFIGAANPQASPSAANLQSFIGAENPQSLTGAAYPLFPSGATHPLSPSDTVQFQNFLRAAYQSNLQNTASFIGSPGPSYPGHSYPVHSAASSSSVHHLGSSSDVHASGSSRAVHTSGSPSVAQSSNSFSDLHVHLNRNVDVNKKTNARGISGITNIQETIRSEQQSSIIPSLKNDNTQFQFQHREFPVDSSHSFPQSISAPMQPDILRRNQASSTILKENFRSPQEIRLPQAQTRYPPQSSPFSDPFLSNLQSPTMAQDIERIHSQINQEILPINDAAAVRDNLRQIHQINGDRSIETSPTDRDLRPRDSLAEISPESRLKLLQPPASTVKAITDQTHNLGSPILIPGVKEPETSCCELMRNLKGRCCSRSSSATKDSSKSQCCLRSGVRDLATDDVIKNNGRQPCKVVRTICYVVYKPSGKTRICKLTQTEACL